MSDKGRNSDEPSKFPYSRELSRSLDSFFENRTQGLFVENETDGQPEKKRRRVTTSSDDSSSPVDPTTRRTVSKRGRFRTTLDETEAFTSETDESPETVDIRRGREIDIQEFSLLRLETENMERAQINETASMTLKEARSLIPRFDGTKPDEVKDLIRAYTYAHLSVAPADQYNLLQAVLQTKLAGKAAKDLEYRKIDSYVKLKEELNALYGAPRTVAALQVDFNMCKQKSNETVLEYGLRLEKIMMDLIEASTMNEVIDVKKEAIENYIRQLALHNFERGLRREYQIIVKARGFADLQAALKGAMEEEKSVQGNETLSKQASVNKRPPITCHKCQKLGHLAKDCRSSTPSYGRFSLPAPAKNVHQLNLICHYCQKPGHILRECRKRIRELGQAQGNRQGSVNYQQNVQGTSSRSSQHQWNANKSKTHGYKQTESKENNNEGRKTIGSFTLSPIVVSDDVEIRRVSKSRPKPNTGAFKNYCLPVQRYHRAEKLTSHNAGSDFHVKSPQAKEKVITLKGDTGAQCSLIKKGVLLNETEIIEETVELKGIGGYTFSALCKIELVIETPAVNIRHEFFVIDDAVPLDVDGILGMDFIRKHNVDILSGKFIKIYGHSVPLFDASKKLKLPPRSENILYAKTLTAAIGCVVATEILPGVRVGESIAQPYGHTCPVIIRNSCEEAVEINRPTVEIDEIDDNERIDVEEKEVNTLSSSERIERHNKLWKEIKGDSNLNSEEEKILREFSEEFADVFHLEGETLGCTDVVEHQISVKEGTSPVKIRPYRLPELHKREVMKQTEEMLSEGIIRPSKSPWNAPLLVVPKKPDADGNVRKRVVVDFRKLNEVTEGDSYPLPNITDILDQLGRAKYFTTLDLASGFHQIPMAEKDKQKTAFSTPLGHYEYNRMPFGLKNAPPTFQRLMDAVLTGLQGLKCYVYLDDIVIYGASLEEHNERLREVFQRLREARLKVQAKKCQFLRKETQYLGHVITEIGVKPDPEKIKAVQKFPVPRNVKEVQSFLGLAGYYRKFIHEFSKFAKPLTDLTKKEQRYEWTTQCQQAFNKLKDILSTAPILQYPNFEKPFVITTDASDKAIGAILSQGKIGEDLPICYASRTLNKAEINYSTTEKEMLAIVWAIAQFRPYVYGTKFTIVTDHKPLTWLFSVKDPGSRLMRWRIKLEEYDYEIEYKAGKKNTNADALSRMYMVICAKDKDSKAATDSAPKRKRGRPRKVQPPPPVADSAAPGNRTEQLAPRRRGRPRKQPTSPTEPTNTDTPSETTQASDSTSEKSESESETEYHTPESATPSEKERAVIMQEYHDAPLGGHPGVKRMMQRIKMKYNWPGMDKEIKDYVSTCDKCQKNKVAKVKKSPMVITDTPEKAFEKCAVDIVGPLPLTEQKHKYILTFQDALTKYSAAIPLVTQEAKEVAKKLATEIICRYGTPKIILSDQGTNFLSETFKEMCKLLAIGKIQTSAYHPQSNGALERSHRTLAEYLKNFIREDQRDWDEWLPYAMFTYNTTPHTATGLTPYELVFGKTAELPTSIKEKPRKTYTYDDYVAELRERLRATWQVARERLVKRKERVKESDDKKKHTTDYRPGDRVLLHDSTMRQGRSAKLTPRWTGPYTIRSRESAVTYIIGRGRKALLVHADRIKPYVSH